jgi:hypothetical protein
VAILVGGVLAGIPIAGGYLYGSLIFGVALVSLGVWLMRPASSGAKIAAAASS